MTFLKRSRARPRRARALALDPVQRVAHLELDVAGLPPELVLKRDAGQGHLCAFEGELLDAARQCMNTRGVSSLSFPLRRDSSNNTDRRFRISCWQFPVPPRHPCA